MMLNKLTINILFIVPFIILIIPNECQTQKGCKKDEFACFENSLCKPLIAQCDGKIDCINKKDESFELCGLQLCAVTQFHCSNGACIPLSLKCNTYSDCFDGSDEADCEMIPTKQCPNDWMVSCLSGECIRQDQICDGVKDCMDNSDETYTTCSSTRCPTDTFRCDYGACVDLNSICNGIPDCVDYSDELLPQCKSKSNLTSQSICGNDHFKCNSGLCIKEEKLCDGIRDCDDGSDEIYRQCKNKKCRPEYRRCSYGACGNSSKCVDISNGNDTRETLSTTTTRIPFSSTLIPLYPPIPTAAPRPTAVPPSRPPPPQSTPSQPTQPTRPPTRRTTTFSPLIDEPITTALAFPDEDTEPPNSEEKPITPSIPEGGRTEMPTPIREGCIYPDQPRNGEMKANTGKIPEPYEPAPEWTIIIFTCNDEYTLGNSSSVIVCMNKKWTSSFPRCLKTCPPLISHNHEIECIHDEKKISCDQAFEGTVANVKCKEAFEIKNFVYQPFNGVQCISSGNWSRKLFDCNPECGTLIPKSQALVIKGYTPAKGEFPWHAGIYRRDSNDDKFYEQICGGTLISEKVIISAAHCFWDWKTNEPNLATGKYAIAVGKFYRTWNSTSDKHAQHRKIERIILPKRFRADDSNFANDIAMLILNKAVKFTPRIRPVCVDWSNELYKTLLKPGALGAVAGWGLTQEFGFAAEELQAVRMPYIEYDTCVSNLPEIFRPFITQDKICAGYNNGTSICTGDSGGGIAFKKNNRYFIEGIVSVAPAKATTCDSYQYVAFTSVPQHLNFIVGVERETH